MSRIFWDTNLFIYYFERSPQFQIVDNLLTRMIQRGDELLTSTLTLGEVLVAPLEAGNTELAKRYEDFIDPRVIGVVPFDLAAARIYSTIRRDRSIRAPDAMQLACAVATKAKMFITNDARLSRKTIPGIDFIVPLDRVYL
jgi:predicted nucleic acid-binding protein